MEIKNIIFDFDGVILNSHRVKTSAFEDIFKKYGNSIAKKAKEYHLKHTGKSRYLKFLPRRLRQFEPKRHHLRHFFRLDLNLLFEL